MGNLANEVSDVLEPLVVGVRLIDVAQLRDDEVCLTLVGGECLTILGTNGLSTLARGEVVVAQVRVHDELHLCLNPGGIALEFGGGSGESNDVLLHCLRELCTLGGRATLTLLEGGGAPLGGGANGAGCDELHCVCGCGVGGISSPLMNIV